ncbi:recombinase family protein [Streptomyces sp. NPDC052036]|uniref:recombinase family protein n=1 Tax=Streptomyces sp. NPDC052036 TaxID=3155171 RepID=UPI003412F83A
MTALMPWERVDGKVTERHRDALAIVYVRQSTRQQVRDHGESTRLQYALVDRAVALGWQACRVLVIDDDLGRSGTSALARPGFQRLVSEVSLGHVGLVLGIEMSRLARSEKDFYQLLELCALAGALLADTDGVYDPGDVNDRMLLGLKGTMSAVELHLIKQRMHAGKVNKARRGELGFALPMVRRPSGEPVLDPDEQVRAAVRLVFAKFAELGTLNGVLRYLVVNGIDLPLRARSGPDKGELVWRRPNRATLQWMLHSPIYAGIYAYGRRRVDPRRKVAGRPATGKVVVDPDQWTVMIPGALPAYISEQTWRDNLARLAANASRADTTGAARRGSALLSGLVHCGRCGKRMTVRYHVREGHRQADYACARELVDYSGRLCQAMAGSGIDAYVTEQVLAALEPAAVEVSLHAAEQIEADRARVDRIWRQRIERAGIDVDRARRCYCLAEPENRLVVRQLEHDWEQALAAQQQLRKDYARFTAARPPILTPAERAAVTARAADIRALWHAETTTNTDRKEIIRARSWRR